ncbi:MAG TPA: hypothetical protein VFZ76_03130, partial [Anaerolineales bacterium]
MQNNRRRGFDRLNQRRRLSLSKPTPRFAQKSNKPRKEKVMLKKKFHWVWISMLVLILMGSQL